MYPVVFFGGPTAGEDERDEMLCPKLHKVCGQANEQTVFARVQPGTRAQGHQIYAGNNGCPREGCRAWGGGGEAVHKGPGYKLHEQLWRSGLP